MIDQIIVKGINSGDPVTIRIDVVKELVEAYMCVIPNDKRTLEMSLKVMRLHDALAKLVKSEFEAADGYIEKKVTEDIAKTLIEEEP